MKKTITLLILILLFTSIKISIIPTFASEISQTETTFYDFIQNADKAKWSNGFVNLPFPGSDTDSRGFALWRTNAYLEDNLKYSKVLETHPEWKANGWIIGSYPYITIPKKAKLVLKIGFLKGATSTDGVEYSISYIYGGDSTRIFTYYKKYTNSLYSTTVDLSKIEGLNVSFELKVYAGGKSSTQDWACWVEAKIVYEETKPDLTITDIRVSGNRVYYKLKNIGNAPLFYGTPIPFTNTLYINGLKVHEENININLNPNEEYETYFKNYNFVEPTSNYKLKVCCDTNNYINESNETNNCLEKTFTPSLGGIKVYAGCPEAKVDIFNDKGVLVKSGYTDSNGVYLTGLTLIPGTYKVVPSKENHYFNPKESYVNVIPNQYVGVYFVCNKIVTKKPDLIVESLNCDFEKKVINFTIANIGEEKVSLPFEVSLFIDGVLKDSVTIEKVLNPKERYSSSFVKYVLQCTNLKVKVIVDYGKKIDEENEENNVLEKECKCEQKDETPPKIVEGPQVINITQNSAEVIWKTDEESDSGVFYDSKPNSFSKSSFDKNFVINHKIKLTNLKPGTVYEFYVESKDRSGNSVKSKTKYFKTLEEEDKEKPTVELIVPQNLVGRTKIIANVRDNKGIDRVVFYVDNKEVFVDYSPPYEYMCNTNDLYDGKHTFQAIAFDLSGNNSIAIRESSVVNRLISAVVEILEPIEGSMVYGDENIKVRVYCSGPICGILDIGVERIEYYLNNQLISYENFAGERCYYRSFRERICIKRDPMPLPFEHNITYHFKEANREYEREVEIKVIVFLSTGSPISKSIKVYRRFIPIEEIRITREVNLVNNYYDVNLIIKNTGNVNFSRSLIEIFDYHSGFEVGTDIKFIKWNGIEDLGWEYDFGDINFTLSRQQSNYTLSMYFKKSNFFLEPDQFIKINYKLVPILYDLQNSIQHIIGSRPVFFQAYEGEINGSSFYSYLRSYDLLVNKELEYINLTRVSDYLIVTDVKNLYRYNWNSFKDCHNLLFTMGQLAIEKNGILGFFVTDNNITPDDYRNVIRIWGFNYLKSDWSNNGYLLLVGETEIIPAFTALWDANYDSEDDTIRWTDSPYASTGGEDIHPEIFIGRIIGDDAAHLRIPIETSLKVKNGKLEFCRNNSPCASAMIISGVGNHQARFTCFADDLEDDDEGDLGSEFQVYYLRGSSFHDDENKTATEKRREAFLNNVSGRDVIVYRGHGYCIEPPNNGGGWADVIATWDIDRYGLNFGNTAPFIFSISCCTGRYAFIRGFGEVLFEHGVGIFIGATEVTYGGEYCCCEGTNDEEGRKFFEAWLNHPNKTIAEAWRERRQDIAYELWFENSRYWSTVYQFYGDPKFDKK